MDLYEGDGALLYDEHSAGISGDILFYLEEAQASGEPVLELGCGTGRVLLPLAKAGLSVVGVDRSAAMLAVSREKLDAVPPETRERVTLIESDMRDFSLKHTFPIVLIPYRSFHHLLTVEDQKDCLRCVLDHLEPDGRLIVNLYDPKIEVIAGILGQDGSTLSKSRELRHPKTGNLILVWRSRQCDPGRQVILDDLLFERFSEDGFLLAKTHFRQLMRYTWRTEMEHLLDLCGFEVDALYGDFQRNPYQPGSEQIWVVRRRS